MPLIRKAKGIYALYKGKPKKTVHNNEIVGYYINYRDKHNKPIKERVEANTVAEAQVLLKQRIVQRDRDREENPATKAVGFKKETISTIAAKYFATRPGRGGDKDKASYHKHLDGEVGEAKFIKPMDVKLLQNKLLSKGLANKTINTYVDMLRTILNFEVNNGFLRGDSYIMKSYSKLEVDNIVERFMTPKEVRELFEKSLWSDAKLREKTESKSRGQSPAKHADTAVCDRLQTSDLNSVITPPYQKLRLQFFLKSLYYSGQRPISVLRLQKKDIQGNQGEGYRINIISVKKQRQHYVHVSSAYVDDLLSWIKPLNQDDYLFHSERTPSERTPGKPISIDTLHEQAKPLFSHYNQGLDYKADRKHWTSFYTMRHSAATNILAAKGSAKLAGKLLNHSDPRMTDRYVKVIDAQMIDAVNSL